MEDQPERKFGELLTKAIRIIAAKENKEISVIEDELGHMLEYHGGKHIVERWRKGHVPDYPKVLEIAQFCIERGGMDVEWSRQFLDYGRVPERERHLQELFPKASLEYTSPSKSQQSLDKEDEFSKGKIEGGKQPNGKNQEVRRFLVPVGVIVIVILLFVTSRSLFVTKSSNQEQSTNTPPVSAQLPLTGGSSSMNFPPPPTAVPFKITSVTFDPLPPAKTDQVKIFACTQGLGGVGITLRVSVNTAPDGSDNGQRVNLGELGVPCFNQDNAPVWNTKGWKPGTYLVKIEAKTSDDPSWTHPIVVNVPYTLK